MGFSKLWRGLWVAPVGFVLTLIVACGSSNGGADDGDLGDGGLTAADASGGSDGGASSSSGSSGSAATYSVGGTVTGLLGEGLVLESGALSVTLPKNATTFAFPTKVAAGTTYDVKLKTQPSAPTQACTVTSGAGAVASADVTSVKVACTTSSFDVSVNVTGVLGAGLVLQNNAAGDLSVPANAGALQKLTFTAKVESGKPYAVTVKTPPAGPNQTCVLGANAAGTMGGSNVEVDVTCATTKYKVGGTVAKMAGTGLVLQNDGVDLPAINANGAFSVDVEDGKPYAFTVKTLPGTPRQICKILSGASGTVAGANVTDVVVSCGYVVLLGAPGIASWANDVKAKIDGTNAFTQVDIFNVASQVPTLDQLGEYDAALVYSDNGFGTGTLLGDRLADWFDAGGRVVVAVFTNASIPLAGRWGSGNYHLISPAGQTQPNLQSAITIEEAASPLVTGVVSLTATFAFMSTGGAINGGVVVAKWGNGRPLIVRGEKDGKRYAAINMYPPSVDASSGFWEGSGAEIMRNALLY